MSRQIRYDFATAFEKARPLFLPTIEAVHSNYRVHFVARFRFPILSVWHCLILFLTLSIDCLRIESANVELPRYRSLHSWIQFVVVVQLPWHAPVRARFPSR